MSYNTIFACANDEELRARVSAACAQEDHENPEGVAFTLMYQIAAESDVEAAYASALAAGNEHPGEDEGVITDAMILSKVQAFLPAAP